MRRLLKWLLPVFVLAEVVLVRLEILSLRDAVVVLISVEVLLLAVGGTLMLSAVREYRRDRAAGSDGWRAFEHSLGVLLPRLAARLISSEIKLFYCLAKWMLRRTRLQEGEFSYHKRSTMDMFVLMVVFVSPIEILVIELLLQAFLPLIWLRILVLVLEVYFLFWVVGFHASRVVLPHRLGETGLQLHHGVFAEGFVPYKEIQGVERTRQKAPEWGDGLQVDEDTAYLAIGGNTNISIELRSPRSLRGFLRKAGPVDTIRLAVDESEAFAKDLRHRVCSLAASEKVFADT